MQVQPHSHAGRRLAVSLGVSALAIVLLAPMASAATPKTKLASQSSAEVQAQPDNTGPDISATGRFVVFGSDDDNLASGDANNEPDVFIRDFKKGTTKLLSKSLGGGAGDGESWEPSISANGRFVAFSSDATDLVLGDSNAKSDVFVRDRAKNKTELISQSSSGTRGNGNSWDAVISADGRWVAFKSKANNLVGKDTKGQQQIYLFDRDKDKLILVSRSNGGRAGNARSDEPAISANGRYVVYWSDSLNLTSKDTKGNRQVFKFDRVSRKTVLISRNNKGKAGNGASRSPAISADGARVVFGSLATNFVKDTNGVADAYMRDRKTRKTRRVSLNWKGKQLNGGNVAVGSEPDISANGKWVAFESAATNAKLVDTNFGGDWGRIYARNIATGKIKLVSKRAQPANDESSHAQLSKTGAFVAFDSVATNLIAGGDSSGDGSDIFRRGPIN